MPIYEYLCTDCNSVSEQLVFSDDEVVRCTQCGSGNLRKLLSASSSASGTKSGGSLPGIGDTACCGTRPGSQNCLPGTCCGKIPGPNH